MSQKNETSQRARTIACVLTAGVLQLSSCQFVPDSAAPATPQRPTLSSDTSTTPDGLIELEVGLARDDAVSLDSPLTLKFGTGPRTEVALGWSPWKSVDTAGGDEKGPGDVVIGLRHRLGREGKTTYALQSLVKIPTAEDPELGTGEVDAQFAGIASSSFGEFSGTGYYAIGAVGDPVGGSSVSHSLAIALGTPVTDSVGAFAEVAGVLVPEVDAENVFTTIGLTHTPEPSLVLDAAVVLGLTDEAADWQFLVGLTKNFGRIGRASQ